MRVLSYWLIGVVVGGVVATVWSHAKSTPDTATLQEQNLEKRQVATESKRSSIGARFIGAWNMLRDRVVTAGLGLVLLGVILYWYGTLVAIRPIQFPAGWLAPKWFTNPDYAFAGACVTAAFVGLTFEWFVRKESSNALSGLIETALQPQSDKIVREIGLRNTAFNKLGRISALRDIDLFGPNLNVGEDRSDVRIVLRLHEITNAAIRYDVTYMINLPAPSAYPVKFQLLVTPSIITASTGNMFCRFVPANPGVLAIDYNAVRRVDDQMQEAEPGAAESGAEPNPGGPELIAGPHRNAIDVATKTIGHTNIFFKRSPSDRPIELEKKEYCVTNEQLFWVEQGIPVTLPSLRATIREGACTILIQVKELSHPLELGRFILSSPISTSKLAIAWVDYGRGMSLSTVFMNENPSLLRAYGAKGLIDDPELGFPNDGLTVWPKNESWVITPADTVHLIMRPEA